MSNVENLNRVRHPEKAKKPEHEPLRKPAWIRVKAPTSEGYHQTRKLMRERSLHTVCEEAACPNIGECWAAKHATVMILGDICTRACAFCNVATGKPGNVDPMEPENLAISVAELGMKHLVITSVDRDDLADGGADQFVKCIERIREIPALHVAQQQAGPLAAELARPGRHAQGIGKDRRSEKKQEQRKQT